MSVKIKYYETEQDVGYVRIIKSVTTSTRRKTKYLVFKMCCSVEVEISHDSIRNIHRYNATRCLSCEMLHRTKLAREAKEAQEHEALGERIDASVSETFVLGWGAPLKSAGFVRKL
jgi:hypothetical protein